MKIKFWGWKLTKKHYRPCNVFGKFRGQFRNLGFWGESKSQNIEGRLFRPSMSGVLGWGNHLRATFSKSPFNVLQKSEILKMAKMEDMKIETLKGENVALQCQPKTLKGDFRNHPKTPKNEKFETYFAIISVPSHRSGELPETVRCAQRRRMQPSCRK